jgi:hypothetical protein
MFMPRNNMTSLMNNGVFPFFFTCPWPKGFGKTNLITNHWIATAQTNGRPRGVTHSPRKTIIKTYRHDL